MTDLLTSITSFLTKTTAIMTAVIILMLIAAWLVATENKPGNHRNIFKAYQECNQAFNISRSPVCSPRIHQISNQGF